MKKWQGMVGGGVLLAVLATSGVPAFAQQAGEPVKLFSINVTGGAGAAAYTPLLEDLEHRGPESFAVDANGTVYLLDTIDAQVEVIDSKGKSKLTVKLPTDKEFSDIELGANGAFYVLSDIGEVLEYKNGALAGAHKIPYDAEKMDVLGLFRSGSDVVVRYLDGTEYVLATKSKAAGQAGFQGKRVANGIEFAKGADTLQVAYEHQPAGTQLLTKTAAGEQLVLENEAIEGQSLYVETKVGFYKNGKLAGTALALPTNDRYATKVPNKFVYAASNGKVYQMVNGETSVDIYELPKAAGKQSRLTSGFVQKIQGEEKVEAQGIITPDAVNLYGRATAYDRAIGITGYVWTFYTANRTPTTSTTTSPDFLVSAANGSSQQGIPYTWGGFDSLDTSSSKANWANYAAGLSIGKYAGNVHTSGHNYISSTVGLDCSGFISAVYGFSYKFSTGMLQSDVNTPFRTTTYGALQPGDIANDAGSHVWMFISRKTDSAGNLVGYFTREATVSGTGDKAKYYSRTTAEAQAYVPMTLK